MQTAHITHTATAHRARPAPASRAPLQQWGCRDAVARHSPARRKSSSACGPRSPGAPLVRTSRTNLTRGRSVASRFWSMGAAANRPASPCSPTFFGGYSHD
jgi:hypothetical protein